MKWHSNCLYFPESRTPSIFFLVKFKPTGILNVTVYILDEFHLGVLLLRQTILWHQCLIRPFPQTQQGVLPEIWWYKSWSFAVSNFYYSLYASLWKGREDKRRGREFNWKIKYYNLSDKICLHQWKCSISPLWNSVCFSSQCLDAQVWYSWHLLCEELDAWAQSLVRGPCGVSVDCSFTIIFLTM